MCGPFLAILRLSPPLPPLADPLWGGIFTPWTEFDWGGTDGGGLNSGGGGFFGDASGSRGSPPISENPALSSEIRVHRAGSQQKKLPRFNFLGVS